MKKYLPLFILLSLTWAACSKENSDLFIPYAGNPANDTTWVKNLSENSVSNTLFNGLASTPFIDSFNVTGSALFHVNANLDIAIPAACLAFTDGSAIPSGKVRAEIRHLLRRGDFIRYARPTTSFGKLFESGSAFEVKFFKQDQELMLKPGKKLFFTVFDSNPVNDIDVYFGNTVLQQPLPVGTNPFFTWAQATDSSFASPFVHHDTSGTKKGYQVFAGKTCWINCQYPLENIPAKTNITVTLPPNFTNGNTATFLVIKQRKVIAQLNGDYDSRSFFAPNIPLGNTIQLVSLSLIGSQYYLGFKEINTSQDMIEMVNPVAKTKEEINQFLNGL